MSKPIPGSPEKDKLAVKLTGELNEVANSSFARNLDGKVLRALKRACDRVSAETGFYVPVRLEQSPHVNGSA